MVMTVAVVVVAVVIGCISGSGNGSVSLKGCYWACMMLQYLIMFVSLDCTV